MPWHGRLEPSCHTPAPFAPSYPYVGLEDQSGTISGKKFAVRRTRGFHSIAKVIWRRVALRNRWQPLGGNENEDDGSAIYSALPTSVRAARRATRLARRLAQVRAWPSEISRDSASQARQAAALAARIARWLPDEEALTAPPRCPRTAVNSQQPPPPAHSGHKGNPGADLRGAVSRTLVMRRSPVHVHVKMDHS